MLNNVKCFCGIITDLTKAQDAYNTTPINDIKALPNIDFSVSIIFHRIYQFDLTQVLPPLSAGITKNDPNNSIGWMNKL